LHRHLADAVSEAFLNSPAPETPRPSSISNPALLQNLTVKPVERIMFRTETVTDGNIVINDDITTPVFSPFSGRVTRVIAKLGGSRAERLAIDDRLRFSARS
jgi:hypothetical protein